MIGNILSYIASELNLFICKSQGISPGVQKVIMSPIMNPDGSLAIKEENVILMTFVDAYKDSLINSYQQGYSQQGVQIGSEIGSTPLRLNLHVLFSAHFAGEKYKSALNNLTYVFRFFQGSAIMDRQNTPTLPKSIEKLEFHMQDLGYHDRSHLWGVIGAKYMPSVLYQVRLLTIGGSTAPEFVASTGVAQSK